MSSDISEILDRWPFEQGTTMVRRFVGGDGSEKIQMRIDLGILQMNAQGRPDGKRPFGRESLLDHFRNRLQVYKKREGTDEGFHLEPKECLKLQQEAIQYHHRYICYFQLEDYPKVIRDTERNLAAMRFASQYAPSEELAWGLSQLTPQLIMIQTRSRASLALKDGHYALAIQTVKDGLGSIEAFFESIAHPELLDQSGEIQALELWLEDLRENRPLSKREQLEEELNEAVRQENYERAAAVRDAIRNLKPSHRP